LQALQEAREAVDHNGARAGQIAAVSGALLTLLASNVIDMMGAATGGEHAIVQASLVGGLLMLSTALVLAGSAGFRKSRPQLGAHLVRALASPGPQSLPQPTPLKVQLIDQIYRAIWLSERAQRRTRLLLRAATYAFGIGLLLALVAALTISIEVN
jgi:hypothetical protein